MKLISLPALFALAACGGGTSPTVVPIQPAAPTPSPTPTPTPAPPPPSDSINSVVISPSGNNRVDGILSGRAYETESGGERTILTFSFTEVNSQTSNSNPSNGWDANREFYSGLIELSSVEKTMMRGIFNQIENVALLDFNELPNTEGIIRVAWASASNFGGATAWANDVGYPFQSDIWISTGIDTGGGFRLKAVLMHELGHAIGLKHPHDSTFFDYILNRTVQVPQLADQWDSRSYTVMSYNATTEHTAADFWPQTLMYLDILALQHLYGSTPETNAGDTVYSYDGTNRYYETIWDTGGNDTIEITNVDRNLLINISPDSWSDVGTLVTWTSQAGGGGSFTETVYIPPEIIIENITSSNGDDTLIGNNVANRLNGGGGDDTLTSGDGDDIFVFDTGWGQDTITDFADSEDMIDLSNSGLVFADLTITTNGSNTVISDGSGNEITLVGVTGTITQDDFMFG